MPLVPPLPDPLNPQFHPPLPAERFPPLPPGERRGEGRHESSSRPGSWSQCSNSNVLGLPWAALLSFILLLAPTSHALDWQAGPGFRSAALTVIPEFSNGFVRVHASTSAITFTNTLPVDRFTTNQISLNGSGVCAGDVDGDGWTDLFFAGLGGRSTFYRNRGDWRFEDITRSSGLAALCQTLDTTGTAFADTDGDGDLDLVLNSTGGGTHTFLNDGQGRFQRSQILNPGRGATSLALADIDGDGDLDLYVANYRTETLRDQPRTQFRIGKTNGQFVVTLVNNRPTSLPALQGRFTYLASGSIVENGEPDALFINQGTNGFVAVGFTEGAFLDESGKPLTEPPYDWGLSVLLRDLNGDGQPDLYVCNDFASVDRFWINQGAGRFRAAPALTLRNTSKFSMGVDAADINRDGHDDLYVLDMMSRDHAVRLTRMDASMEARPPGAIDQRPQLARSTLQLARSDGTFAEIAQYAGLEASEWAWTPLFIDIDLDGYEDLLIATGHARDDMHIDYGMRIEAIRKSSRLSTLDELALRKNTPPIATPCLAYRNLGNLRFEEVPNGWGWGDRVTVSQGTCLADLDNDGDLDLAVNRLNDVAGVYRNQGSGSRIAVRLKGLPPNTRGVGSRILLHGGSVGTQTQEIQAGGRYLSADDSMRVFAASFDRAGAKPTGMAPVPAPLRLEVRWRSGKRSVIPDVRPNHLYEIIEAQATSPPPPSTSPQATPLFADDSAQLGYRHYEAPFDDFERQPLLPRRASQAGPGVAWLDLNGDGREDLFVTSGKGGRPGLFLTAANGRFQLVDPAPVSLDQNSVVGWPYGARRSDALVAASAYEDPDAGGAAILAYDASGARTEVLSLGNDNPGPLALADIDADGDLDLFVGGGPIGGRYPLASPSRLFERSGDSWRASAANNLAFTNTGMVSGAVWSDLDADGFPELALACEWGPIRLYQNQRGQLREVTTERGLHLQTGWWTGIQAGDFDSDGRLDLVAGNWGLNSRYRPTREHPVRLYFGDLAGQGRMELIEASFDTALTGWVPERDLTAMSKPMPWLRETFPHHAAYARAKVDDLIAGREVSPRSLEASTLATTVFLNRGDRFEAIPLPPEAQLAPVFGINVADFNLDGHLDLFLAQNFFAVTPAISGQDAGRGLLLLGNGRGGFSPISGTESGIRIYGEQRGSAVADYNSDGRPDLAVSQNTAEARLFRNAANAPGLQIRVRGPAGNPNGIGTLIRVVDPAMPFSPVHEIHAGSGYRSQDAPSVFLPRPKGPTTLEVRGPDGRTSRHPIRESDATSMVIDLTSSGP